MSKTHTQSGPQLPPNAAPFFRRRNIIDIVQSPNRQTWLEKHPDDTVNILMIGDIVGKPGRDTLAALLPKLREERRIDLVVANTENLAHGFGITVQTIAEISSAGVDICTGGNHTWKNAAGFQWLQNEEPDHVLKPANIYQGDGYPERPGADHAIVRIPGFAKPIIILSLLGEVFMKDDVYSPFATFDALFDLYGNDALYITDLHAEATGEKRIFGWHTDGRASIVVGTHTHVPTADEQKLLRGTVYISDLGFTGAIDSSLGMRKDLVQKKVVLKHEISLEPPEKADMGILTGLHVSLDRATGKVVAFERIAHKTSLS